MARQRSSLHTPLHTYTGLLIPLGKNYKCIYSLASCILQIAPVEEFSLFSITSSKLKYFTEFAHFLRVTICRQFRLFPFR